MANRRRYKELEQLMTRVLLADAAVFVLFLLFSGLGLTALKVITAIIAILVSLLCLAFLSLNGEIKKRRSLWLVVGFVSIVICLLASLLLKYPSPAPEAIGALGDAAATGTSAAGAALPSDAPLG